MFHKKFACVCHADSKTLCDALTGSRVRIKGLCAEEGMCHRLREMGFCESSVVEKVADSGTLICRVCEAKVMISKDLAQKIVVQDICPCKGHEHEHRSK